MRNIWILFLIIFGCSKPQKTIPNIAILIDSEQLTKKNDIVYYKNQLFNGHLIEKNIGGKLIAKSGYFNGKIDGLQQKWFGNGSKKEVRFYENNLKVGKHEAWYQNGNKRFEYFIEKDIPIGVHQEWFENGQPFSLFTYNNLGQPEGLQKMWFENGQTKANYVVKNGRRYGLLGAKGCQGMQERKTVNLP